MLPITGAELLFMAQGQILTVPTAATNVPTALNFTPENPVTPPGKRNKKGRQEALPDIAAVPKPEAAPVGLESNLMSKIFKREAKH